MRKLKEHKVKITKLKKGDTVIVDKLKWRKKYDAKITWLGEEWAQILSDRGVQTVDQARLTFKSRD